MSAYFNNYGHDFDDFCRRQAVAVSAATLTKKGCVLKATPDGGWEVTVPEGNTFFCEDWRDLARMSREGW